MTLDRGQSHIGADARADRPHNLLPNCLDRCSFCPLFVVVDSCRCLTSRWSRFTLSDGASARRRTTDRRTAHGNGTAFSAVAPSKRPIFAAHRSNIREWYCPQARIAGHLTFQPLGQFQPAPRLSVGPIRIVQECGAFATYRRVSCAFTSTICIVDACLGEISG
jgi:hypothetical protein